MKSLNLSLRTALAQRGFSLLETLIASTIFASVLLIASSAFKFFMSANERPINSEAVLQEAMSTIRVRDSIKSIAHYYLKEPGETVDTTSPFFWGDPEGFTGISNSSIKYHQQPTRITLSKTQSDNNKLHLVYCEYDNSSHYPTKNTKPQCNFPIVIADNATKIQFSYFGWSTLNRLYGIVDGKNAFETDKLWTSTWDASDREVLPQYIKIELEYELGNIPQLRQLWFHIADANPVRFNIYRQTDG